MTDQKTPLTSIQIESLIADLLETKPKYDLDLHYQLLEQIRALEAEIERLKIWGSDSHVTDLLEELWESGENPNFWKNKAEAAEKERDEWRHQARDTENALVEAYAKAERQATDAEKRLSTMIETLGPARRHGGSMSDKNQPLIEELSATLNRHSMENGSDTPDFILATFLSDALNALDKAVAARERWYGRAEKHGGKMSHITEAHRAHAEYYDELEQENAALRAELQDELGNTEWRWRDALSELLGTARSRTGIVLAVEQQCTEIERLRAELAEAKNTRLTKVWIDQNQAGEIIAVQNTTDHMNCPAEYQIAFAVLENTPTTEEG